MFTLVLGENNQSTITAQRATELINNEPNVPTVKTGNIDGRTIVRLDSIKALIIGPAMQRKSDTLDYLREKGANI